MFKKVKELRLLQTFSSRQYIDFGIGKEVIAFFKHKKALASEMSPLSSLFFALVLGLAFSGFSFSVADRHKILQRDPSEAFCPLNFDVLRKLVIKGVRRPAFRDIPTQCHYFLEGIRLILSEYLRTNGYFLPPPTTSKACWESYQSLIGKFFVGFDIQTSCGYHPEWISKGCKNITSKAEFESQTPESKLWAVKLYCNQYLENTSACELCTKTLLSLGDSYLHGPERANVSDCTEYPFMYAAAVVNKFRPTVATTAKCLFSMDFSLRASNMKLSSLVGQFGRRLQMEQHAGWHIYIMEPNQQSSTGVLRPVTYFWMRLLSQN